MQAFYIYIHAYEDMIDKEEHINLSFERYSMKHSNLSNFNKEADNFKIKLKQNHVM